MSRAAWERAVLGDAREILRGRGRRDAFDDVRDELRRAAWWARTWSCAFAFRERHGGRVDGIPVRRHRDLLEKTILRAYRVRISDIQSWRVHKHEKAAWARLEELTQ